MSEIKEEMTTEEIRILSLANEFDDKLTKYKSTATNSVFQLTNIRGIVIHQGIYIGTDPIVNKDTVEDIIPYLVKTKQNPYHFIIDRNGDIFQLNPIDRCVKHCKASHYTKKAQDYFGEMVCPSWTESERNPHPESNPDNCTVSILLPMNDKEGHIGTNAYNSMIKLCAYIINKYAKGLQGVSSVFTPDWISEDFKLPICFKNDKELLTRTKYDIEKKRSSWWIHYKSDERGYPNEIIQDVVLKK